MTFVGLIGMLLGSLAWGYACLERTRIRVAVFAAAFLLHVIAAFVYHQYVQTSASDAAMYYQDPFGMYDLEFAPATVFVVYVVQALKSLFGGTYLDYFLVFQSFGFFGIALLMRAFEEVYASLALPQPAWTYLLLFLPGIHFWTSAIGKDAPLFTACCLAVWSAMQVRRRYIGLGAAIVLMLLIRPHIAAIAVVCLGWAVFFDRNTHPALRAIIVLGSLGALSFAAATLRSTLELDVTNADSVSDYLATRESVMQTDDVGNTAVLNASYPMRVLSLLFRPLFVDAEGAFGYIASLENVVLLLIVGMLVSRTRLLISAYKAEPFVRYALLSSLGITLALAIDYYNVGLGLRQKTMILPGVFLTFIVVSAVREAQYRAPQFLRSVRSSALPT